MQKVKKQSMKHECEGLRGQLAKLQAHVGQRHCLLGSILHYHVALAGLVGDKA